MENKVNKMTPVEATKIRGNGSSGAEFSIDEKNRYQLWRNWGCVTSPNKMIFIGLNPSTADESENDPTIRRCIEFAKREHCDGMVMLNMFSYRSTDPNELLKIKDLAYNDTLNYLFLYRFMKNHSCVACWGSHKIIKIVKRFPEGLPLRCFGTNKDGNPKHPLYLRADTKLVPYYFGLIPLEQAIVNEVDWLNLKPRGQASNSVIIDEKVEDNDYGPYMDDLHGR